MSRGCAIDGLRSFGLVRVGLPCHFRITTPQGSLRLSNRDIESRAIEAVIAFGRAAGRSPVDTLNSKGTLVDVDPTGPGPAKIASSSLGPLARLAAVAICSSSRIRLKHSRATLRSTSTSSRTSTRLTVRRSGSSTSRGEQLRERHYIEVSIPLAVHHGLVGPTHSRLCGVRPISSRWRHRIPRSRLPPDPVRGDTSV